MRFKLELISLVGLMLLINGGVMVSATTVVNNQVNVSATSGGDEPSQATVQIKTMVDGEVVNDINERVVATSSAVITVASSTRLVLPLGASTTGAVETSWSASAGASTTAPGPTKAQALTIIKWWQEWFNYVRFIFQL